MKRYGITSFLVAATLAATFAQADILLDIPGIVGTSTIAGHEGEIVVDSAQFGGSHVFPKAGPKPCAGPPSKMQLSAMTLTKVSDKSSPELLAATAAGTVFPEVTVRIGTISKAFLESDRYVLSNAFISDYSVSASSIAPSENLSLIFQNLEFVHTDPIGGEESVTWTMCDAP